MRMVFLNKLVDFLFIGTLLGGISFFVGCSINDKISSNESETEDEMIEIVGRVMSFEYLSFQLHDSFEYRPRVELEIVEPESYKGSSVLVWLFDGECDDECNWKEISRIVYFKIKHEHLLNLDVESPDLTIIDLADVAFGGTRQ